MESAWILEGAGERPLCLKRPAAAGRRAETIGPLFTVQDVCRRLGKSQRQVYRYLQSGRISTCARILGQWLFDRKEIERFDKTALPVSLRRFFWEVPLSGLSMEKHKDFILERLLEWGDRQALQWVLRSYPRPVLAEFLRGRGRGVLSKRNWKFWCSLLEVKTAESPARPWRRRGRSWGGVS